MSHYEERLLQLAECHHTEEVMAQLSDLLERSQEEKESYDLLLAIAKNYLKRSNYAVARAILVTLYRQRKTVQCIYYLAMIDYRLGYVERAFEWVNKIPKHQEPVKCRLLRAKILLDIDVSQAVTLLKQLVQDVPQEYEPYELLARHYMSQSNNAKAITYYRVLLNYFEHNIESDTIRMELAQCLIQMEVVDIQEVESLLQDIQEPTAHYLLGIGYIQAKHYEKAIESLELCVQKDSEWIEAFVRLLELYAYNGQEESFERTLSWLLTTLPPYDVALYDTVNIAHQYERLNPQAIEQLAMYVALQEDESDEEWWDALWLFVKSMQSYYGYTKEQALQYLQQYGVEHIERYYDSLSDERSE